MGRGTEHEEIFMETSLTAALPAPKKCAIYTRKSTEHGLQQDFNSLKAQHAICSAYIQSQQHKGWMELERVYEDAAQSGASLERPGMLDLHHHRSIGRAVWR